MKRKEKAEFDSIVVSISGSAKKAFEKAGYSDAEDLSQEVALKVAAARLSIPKGDYSSLVAEEIGLKAFREVEREARSRKRGLKLMDIENAVSVPDVSTPYHFAVAREMAGVAYDLELDYHLMGETLEEFAEHFGVTRQRAHQIINEKRDQMREYLIQ